MRREHATVKSLAKVRLSTVRAGAFLLFLTQIPSKERARQRRQELLGTGEAGVIPSLLSIASGEDPGNRVIANPYELRELRAAIRSGQIPSDMADEFVIPTEAINALPDQKAFLAARRQSLIAQERAFIKSFGLTVSDSE